MLCDCYTWTRLYGDASGINFQDYIPEFRILRLTFHNRKSAPKYCIRQFIKASDSFSVSLKTIEHLHMFEIVNIFTKFSKI